MSDSERIKQAIAKVEAEGNGSKKNGTGFYVGGRYVLTALHVVADTGTRPPTFLRSITLQFTETSQPISATVAEDLCSVDGDWAVLELKEPPPAIAIELGPEPVKGVEWETYGFPDIAPTGMSIDGDVSNPNLHPLQESDELPKHPLIQLYGKQAAAGMGARMNGFSGAPCLVNDKAVGILRSTLKEEFINGRQQRLLFTQAGTLYATPARSVFEFQAKRRKAILPGSWAPPGIIMQDFVVVLSQCEPDSTGEATSAQQVALRGVAWQAYRNVKDRGLGEPYFLAAADAVSSQDRLQECVHMLCNAKVVVFDMTDFEPAIMFLAGIRAVVRRGVTLLSIGNDYALGKELKIPFNITDANIVAHSREQNRSTIGNSVMLLTRRIERGLDAIHSPQYLDLPVYDAIRRLPVERRGIIPSIEGVLVLCPFEAPYATFWDENLKPALVGELEKLRSKSKLIGLASFGVSRSFELNSPRLVSHAVYEAIRRVQSCVIDLSGWSANVLFELGVRLAASGGRTACIIAGNWKRKVRKEWLPQCRSLESHFVADGFRYNPVQTWEGQAAFSNAYGPDAMPLKSTLLAGGLHRLVEHALDVDSEPASRPVFLDLQDQATMFSRDPGQGGRPKPVGLFPGNAKLIKLEEAAEYERLLAAWLYVSNRFTSEEILGNATTRDAAYKVIQSLFERHADRLTAESKSAAGDMMDKIDEWRTEHARSTSN